MVNNLFTFFSNHVHTRNVSFFYVTCLCSIEIWGIPESCSILYMSEFCFSLGLVIVQLEVKLYIVKQYEELLWDLNYFVNRSAL